MSGQGTQTGTEPGAGTGTQTAPGATGTQAAGATGTQQTSTGTADQTQGGKTLPIGGADGAAASIYKPQGIADHLLGQTNEETIDRILKENAGFREAQSKRPQAIAKAEDVTFEWSDKVKAQGGIASDDKALGIFRDLAVKHTFTPDQLKAIPEFFDAAIDAGLIEPPYNADKVLQGLAPADFRGTDQEKATRGSARMLQAENWIKGLPAESGFDDGIKNELRLLTTSVDGVRALETLMKGSSNPSVSTGQGQQERAPTENEYNQRVADKRYWTHNAEYDPAFAKETEDMAKKIWG